MERSLFAFIWKYSKREQLGLLAFTLFTFPFLYATLELPKRIINDAIGAESDSIEILGYEMSQIQFLAALCFGYLGAVLVHGLLKMRLNTMKGVLAERMLRRFRYKLVGRMMRFPKRYFETTSQGEMVSMVTSEAEPMGGLMGDFIAQPVFQAGQMLIIVVFLFLQSVWFGLAGIALIPLQAYIIPMLQRQINLLNKERIKEVRHLSAEIGETAAGITDLRTNGGWRFRLAGFTDRLGILFNIRFKIYQKKFFMKFLNNFITQLTPFFFYLVGGILAIRGEITVGALVAALAAYKDLSSPWKELLAYYNQTQDMALRWDVVVERFAPRGMIDESLFVGSPEEIPHLKGRIEIDTVTVRNADGNAVLDGFSLEIPSGAQVAIKASTQSERRAVAELLTREVIPARGSVRMAGHDIATLHQTVIAARIGYVQPQPYLFSGTVGDNLLMSLRTSPKTVLWDPNHRDRDGIEAERSGNSRDSLKAEWLDPELAGLATRDDINKWWFELSRTLGTDEQMFRAMLGSRMDPGRHPELAMKIVGLRDEVAERLAEEGLDKAIYRFDPDAFNPAVPLGGNLMFAAPRRDISQQGLAAEKAFLSMIIEQGLAEQAIAISQTLVETLHETFGRDGTSHPLFTALGIDEELYEKLVDIAQRRRDKGDGSLDEEEFALLLTVPFAFTAEQIGPAFPESFKEEILNIRRSRAAALRERAQEMFVPIDPGNYLPRLTLLENLIYGRVSSIAGVQTDLIVDAVSDILRAHDLRQPVATNVFDVRTTIGGANLPQVVHERAAFSRATIKKPDVLIFDQALAGSELAVTRQRLRNLLPDTTLIFLNERFDETDTYDMYVEIMHGQVDGVEKSERHGTEQTASADLRRKLGAIQRAELFHNLDARSQRLLAFAAQWYEAQPGTRIFSEGQQADAVYLCLSGLAELTFLDANGDRQHISTVEPGRVIGDLAIIVREPRQVDLDTLEHTTFLRIGAEQFRSVVENDREVLMSLLRTVAGHLSGAAELIRSSGIEVPREMGPPLPPIDPDEGSL
ncbi:ABC transporter transmembrane domain-containing protein [Sulfitobacter sp. S190]|uniref:ABC transporter transmembrane domain-containing protein n=1 Tax=Sulfitobacter sp. S190 TaxID=2867022 RepID=UPI0021A7DBD0|nr:ABC transporter transmembrane domain-containing protein [Sulfitobacter sp. S190]UWR22296.1 cyclic nucleotide-binding domain-containing protein [Sulfitobacter sp. S190]